MIAPGHHNKSLFGVIAATFVAMLALGAYTEYYIVATVPFALLLCWTAWQYFPFALLLLLISLPFSMEYSFNAQLGTDLPDEGLMLIVASMAMLAVCVKRRLIREACTHPLSLLLIATLAWAVLSVLNSTESVVSLKFLLAKCWYFGAFFLAPLIIWKDSRWIIRSAIALASSMVLVTVIVLIRHAIYGFGFNHINDALHPFFRNHVNYSAMLACLLPLLFVLREATSAKSLRRALEVSIVIAVLGVALSYARGAWLAVIIGLVAYWLIRTRRILFAYILTVVIIAASVLWLATNDRYLRFVHDFKTTIFHQDFEEHLVATYRLKDLSTAERFNRWVAGARMVDEGRITGFGPGSFYKNYKQYTVPAFKTWVSENREQSTVHNYFLLIAIEQGWPALLLFVLLIGAAFYYVQRVYANAIDSLSRSMAMLSGVMLAMIMTVNFLSDLVETDKVGSLFLLSLSMLIVADIRGWQPRSGRAR